MANILGGVALEFPTGAGLAGMTIGVAYFIAVAVALGSDILYPLTLLV